MKANEITTQQNLRLAVVAALVVLAALVALPRPVLAVVEDGEGDLAALPRAAVQSHVER